MAALSTVIAGIGLATSLVGTGVQAYGAIQQTEATKRAEALREKQSNLELARQRRQVLRDSLKARAMALLNSTAQGGTGGSGIAGGYGEIGQKTGENLVGISQAGQIGSGIFKANYSEANAQSLVSFGAGLSSFGGTVKDNAETFARLGTYYSGGKLK